MRVALIVPVRNGGEVWRRVAESIRCQVRQPDRVLVVDSESSDGSGAVARSFGFDVRDIPVRDFDHGSTRQMAAEHCREYDLLIYLTQDAELASPYAFQRLLEAFDEPEVAVAYGRQLPRREAGPIEAHARLFNYPAVSERRTLADTRSRGLKVAFTSNSFCAYRACALFAIGGFPSRAIMSEDMIVAARILQAGRAVAYVAEACAYHSHAYSLRQEFCRYFDIGVLHRNEQWLRQTLGKAEGEGFRFVRSEAVYLLKNSALLLPEAWLRDALKLLAYRMGLSYRRMPAWLRRKISMNRGYWAEEGERGA